jgi:hypothetical protein
MTCDSTGAPVPSSNSTAARTPAAAIDSASAAVSYSACIAPSA